MPVKHALLALLAQRDLTGYELKLRFERTLGDFWQLNSGQVYSTLERLRRDGCVARQKEPGAVERSRYTLLPRGRRQLERWIGAPTPRLRPIRDPLYVKLIFTPPEETAALLGSFNAEMRRYGDAVETLADLRDRSSRAHRAGRDGDERCREQPPRTSRGCARDQVEPQRRAARVLGRPPDRRRRRRGHSLVDRSPLTE